MRVNWGPEANQLLLLKLLETHTFKIDADKIAAAWPKENGEGPTVRAIKDQLTRLRDAAWNQADIAASSPRTPRTPRTPRHRRMGSSVPQTPSSNRTRTSATPFSSFAKRARDEVEANEEWQPATPTPKRRESPRKVDRSQEVEVDSEKEREAKMSEAIVVIDDE